MEQPFLVSTGELLNGYSQLLIFHYSHIDFAQCMLFTFHFSLFTPPPTSHSWNTQHSAPRWTSVRWLKFYYPINKLHVPKTRNWCLFFVRYISVPNSYSYLSFVNTNLLLPRNSLLQKSSSK
jgi:hypothetical protein